MEYPILHCITRCDPYVLECLGVELYKLIANKELEAVGTMGAVAVADSIEPVLCTT
jgi:hypothetical protein